MKSAILQRAVLLGFVGSLAGPFLLAQDKPSSETSSGSELVYVGTRSDGPGATIFAMRFDAHAGKLSSPVAVGDVVRPTWLLANPGQSLLYSVSETGNDGSVPGHVYSLKAAPQSGALTELNHVDSRGGGATDLTYDAPSRTLFVANYGGGTASAIPVLPDGSLAPAASVVADYGSGPLPRQKGPRAHAVVLDPTRHYLLVPDLGADRIFIYKFDPKTRKLTPSRPAFLSYPPGTGPRHIIFSPDGKFAYLMTEFAAKLYAYRWDARKGVLTETQNIDTLPPDFKGQRSGGEVMLSANGRYLYASDRKDENALVVYSVEKSSGRLTEVQRISSGGISPWGFSFDPGGRWMLVCNELSNRINVFKVDPETGKLVPTDEKADVLDPSNVIFFEM